jgi:ABC-type dipeptide/oligopeptide/nickel transport system permease component
MLPVLLVTSVLAFGMAHLTPGDPVAMALAGTNATPAQVSSIRHELGMDQPLPVQYLAYMRGAVTGDLGHSIRTGFSVLGEIEAVLPNTLALTLLAMAIAILVGLGLGAVAGLRPGGITDALVSTFCLVGVAAPAYFLGVVSILTVALALRWLPATGEGDWTHLILPSVVLGWSLAAILARLMRSSLIDVMRSDYIITARAKGVPPLSILLIHALRNSLIPVVTVLGVQFGSLLGGAVVVEMVFARRGIGTLLVNAITNRDFPMEQGIILVLAGMFLLVNLGVDVLYSFIDPRLRRET